MKLLVSFLFCLLAATGFSQPAQKLPPNSKIVFFGDSHTANGYGVKDNSVQYQNYGYVCWVNALCTDVQIPLGGVLGVPGETTTQMLARLQSIQSFDANILVVLAGTNDVLYGVPPATSKANLRTIYNTGLAAGMKVIAIPILPLFNQPFQDIAEDFRQNVNAWIRAQTDVTIVDAEAELNAPGYYVDGRHLTPAGAFLLAGKLAVPINNWMAHCLPGSGTVANLSVAVNSNPFLLGSGGTKQGTSGVVASNWQLAVNLAGTINVVGSKEAGSSGEEKQVVTISGTYTGSSRSVTLTNEAADPIALQTGDEVEGVAELEVVSPLVGVASINLKVSANNADYSILLAEGNSMYNTSANTVSLPPGNYLLRTPPMRVGAGGLVADLKTQVYIGMINTASIAPVSAKLKLSNIGVRRLPLNNGPLAYISSSGGLSACPGSPVLLQANTGPGYSYQWKKDGAPLSAQNNNSLSVTSSGTYTLQISSNNCAVLSAPVIVCGCGGSVQYKFIGSGSWQDPGNWLNNKVPPSTLPSCVEIVIDPAVGGECVIDTAVYLTNSASLRIMSGKKLRVVK